MEIENAEETVTQRMESPKSPVSTLIFMDLEATGLPSEIGKKNVHITEISFIAVDRNDFEVDSTLRVLNKLSLCIRPRASVSPGAMFITGLYNDVLENQEEFDDSIPKMLEFFFRRLRPPICLLAHNGKRFDFPVLQAELKRLNFELDSSILCADTLEAFRTICRSPKKQTVRTIEPKENPDQENSSKSKEQNADHKTNNLNSNEHSSKSSTNRIFIDAKCDDHSKSDDEIEILLLDDIESFQNVKEPTDFCTFEVKAKESPQNKNEFVSVSEDERTPKSSRIGMTEVKRPKKVLHFNDNSSLNSPNVERKKTTEHKPFTAAKRKLFPDTTGMSTCKKSASEFNLNGIVSFSLEKLYYHFFGEAPPTSHYAEADCIALSKVCQKVKIEFLSWLDNNSYAFSETKSLW